MNETFDGTKSFSKYFQQTNSTAENTFMKTMNLTKTSDITQQSQKPKPVAKKFNVKKTNGSVRNSFNISKFSIRNSNKGSEDSFKGSSYSIPTIKKSNNFLTPNDFTALNRDITKSIDKSHRFNKDVRTKSYDKSPYSINIDRKKTIDKSFLSINPAKKVEFSPKRFENSNNSLNNNIEKSPIRSNYERLGFKSSTPKNGDRENSCFKIKTRNSRKSDLSPKKLGVSFDDSERPYCITFKDINNSKPNSPQKKMGVSFDDTKKSANSSFKSGGFSSFVDLLKKEGNSSDSPKKGGKGFDSPKKGGRSFNDNGKTPTNKANFIIKNRQTTLIEQKTLASKNIQKKCQTKLNGDTSLEEDDFKSQDSEEREKLLNQDKESYFNNQPSYVYTGMNYSVKSKNYKNKNSYENKFGNYQDVFTEINDNRKIKTQKKIKKEDETGEVKNLDEWFSNMVAVGAKTKGKDQNEKKRKHDEKIRNMFDTKNNFKELLENDFEVKETHMDYLRNILYHKERVDENKNNTGGLVQKDQYISFVTYNNSIREINTDLLKKIVKHKLSHYLKNIKLELNSEDDLIRSKIHTTKIIEEIQKVLFQNFHAQKISDHNIFLNQELHKLAHQTLIENYYTQQKLKSYGIQKSKAQDIFPLNNYHDKKEKEKHNTSIENRSYNNRPEYNESSNDVPLENTHNNYEFKASMRISHFNSKKDLTGLDDAEREENNKRYCYAYQRSLSLKADNLQNSLKKSKTLMNNKLMDLCSTEQRMSKLHQQKCQKIKDVNRDAKESYMEKDDLFRNLIKQGQESVVKKSNLKKKTEDIALHIPIGDSDDSDEPIKTSGNRLKAILCSLLNTFRRNKANHTLIYTTGNPRITVGWARVRNYFREHEYLKSTLDKQRDREEHIRNLTPRHYKNEKFLECINQSRDNQKVSKATEKFNILCTKYNNTIKIREEKQLAFVEIQKNYRYEKQKLLIYKQMAKLYYNNILLRNMKEIIKIGLWRFLYELLIFKIDLEKVQYPSIFDNESKTFIIEYSQLNRTEYILESQMNQQILEKRIKLDIIEKEIQSDKKIEKILKEISTTAGFEFITDDNKQKKFWTQLNSMQTRFQIKICYNNGSIML